jgi:hypothetical protein
MTGARKQARTAATAATARTAATAANAHVVSAMHRAASGHQGSRWRTPPAEGILWRGRSAPESRLSPRCPRGRPVHAGHVASRVRHNRLQPLERRSVHGLDASRPHRLRRTHRTPGALAFPTRGATPCPNRGPDTPGNDGSTAKPAPTKIGRGCRRNCTFPTAREERRPRANTGPLTH